MFLALASNSSDTYAQGVNYYANNGLAKQIQPANSQVFNWDSKTPGIVVLGAQLETFYPDLVASAQGSGVNFTNDAETYLDAIVNGDGRGLLTKGKYPVMFLICSYLTMFVSHHCRRTLVLRWRFGRCFSQPSSQCGDASHTLRHFCPPSILP